MNALKMGFRITKKEVAVVIVILCTILAVFAPAVFGIINVTRKSNSLRYIMDLKVAIFAYQSDYGTFPIPKGAIVTPGSDLLLGTPPSVDPSLPPLPGTANLYQGLCGNFNCYQSVKTSSAVTGVNSHDIPYLNLSVNDVDKDGVGIQRYRDKNGNITYYGIKMDTNYDGKLDGLPDPVAGDFNRSINDVVAIWCNNDQPYDKPNVRWSFSY